MPGAGRFADSCAVAHLWRQVHEHHLAAPEPSREPASGSSAGDALPQHQLAAVDVRRRSSSGSLASWRDAKEELPTSSGSSSPGPGPQQLSGGRTSLTSLLLQQHAPPPPPAADTLSSESGSPLSQRQYSGSVDGFAAAAPTPPHSDRGGLAAGTLGAAADALGGVAVARQRLNNGEADTALLKALAPPSETPGEASAALPRSDPVSDASTAAAAGGGASSAWAGFESSRWQTAPAPASAGAAVGAAGAPAAGADDSRAPAAVPAGAVADVVAAADRREAQHVPFGAPAQASSAGAVLVAPETQTAAAEARSSSSGAPLEAPAIASAAGEGEAAKAEDSSGHGATDAAEPWEAAAGTFAPAAAHADGGLEEAISRAQAALASVRSFSDASPPRSPVGQSPLAVASAAAQSAAGATSPAGPGLSSFALLPDPRPPSPPGARPAPRRTFPTFPTFPTFSRKAEPLSPPESGCCPGGKPRPRLPPLLPLRQSPRALSRHPCRRQRHRLHSWQPSTPAPQPSAVSPPPLPPPSEAAGRVSSSSPASERQYRAPAVHGGRRRLTTLRHLPSSRPRRRCRRRLLLPLQLPRSTMPLRTLLAPVAPEQRAAAGRRLQPQDAPLRAALQPRDAGSDVEARDSAAASPSSPSDAGSHVEARDSAAALAIQHRWQH